MPSTRTHPDDVFWTPATELFGDGAFYQGKPVLEVKALSDRRAEGGGVAILRASPPTGKLIKIVAVALSDEHVFNLSGGGRANKSGKPVTKPGGYTLNPEGQPHSAMIARGKHQPGGSIAARRRGQLGRDRRYRPALGDTA